MSTWRVQGHVFIGTIQVDVTVEEPNGPGRAMVKRIIDGYLPYTLDLCTIGAMKQRKPEEPELTSLYSMDGNYVGSVNAPFDELLPHFIASRTPHQPEFCEQVNELVRVEPPHTPPATHICCATPSRREHCPRCACTLTH